MRGGGGLRRRGRPQRGKPPEAPRRARLGTSGGAPSLLAQSLRREAGGGEEELQKRHRGLRGHAEGRRRGLPPPPQNPSRRRARKAQRRSLPQRSHVDNTLPPAPPSADPAGDRMQNSGADTERRQTYSASSVCIVIAVNFIFTEDILGCVTG